MAASTQSDMAKTDSKTSNAPAGSGTSLSKLPLPPWTIALRPAYFFRLIEYWFFSRVPSRFLLGLPSAIVAFGGVLFLLFLKHDDQQAAVQRYEDAVSDAIRAEEWENASLFLNSLCSLRPHLPHYKYQLAVLKQQLGNEPAAFGLMQQLAPLNGAAGFGPARVWLVQQTLSGKNSGLSKNDLGQQLKFAVSERPTDAQAHQLLADYYVSEQQFRLGETHLRTAAEQAPEAYVALARLQKQLNRSAEQIKSSLDLARNAFQQRLTKDTGDLTARIQWARCHAIENQFGEAELILKEGLALQDAPELRAALSQLYAEIAAKRIQESALNVQLASQLLIQAIAVSPANVGAIAQLSNLPAAQVTVSHEDLKVTVDHWREQVQTENAPAARIVLAQLLKLCGQTTEAIQQLENGLTDHPESRPLLAQLYLQKNRTDEAETIYNQLLNEQDEQSNQSSPQSIYARAALLLQSGRLDDAVAFIRTHREDLPESEQEPLNRIHAAVLDGLVSHLLSTGADESEAALELLKESLSVAPQEQRALLRIASMSCSDSSAASDAEVLLVKMLAEGSFNVSVYNFIGTEALRVGQFEKARRNLETAKRLAPENPMVLNNLALAAIRGPAPDYKYALSLVASVLQILPNHPDALSTRAEVLFAMERWEEADRDLQLALPDRPDSVNVRRLLVLVNEKLGNQVLADRHRDILNGMKNNAN